MTHPVYARKIVSSAGRKITFPIYNCESHDIIHNFNSLVYLKKIIKKIIHNAPQIYPYMTTYHSTTHFRNADMLNKTDEYTYVENNF